MEGNQEDLPCFKDLISVLIECFSIISLGYLSCRFKIISASAEDLNSYLAKFALPMLIFMNIVQMNSKEINIIFMFCIIGAKLLQSLLVIISSLAITRPKNFSFAGALSIMSTQSNDFALGYPLMNSLYGQTKPVMLDYLSLMAPIQLLILNPIGIVMLEYDKAKKKTKIDNLKAINKVEDADLISSPSIYINQSIGRFEPGQQEQLVVESKCSKLAIYSNLFKALARNPLIVASIAGFAVNRLNGPELPEYLSRLCSTLAASFAGPALFSIGLCMSGKFELIRKSPDDLFVASMLVLMKELLLPNLMRLLALIVMQNYSSAEEYKYLVDFAFLYGLLPIAPTACIIAKQYKVLPNVISISLLLSTIISAPAILTAAYMIRLTDGAKDGFSFEAAVTRTMQFASLISLALAILTIYSLWKSRSRLIGQLNNHVIASKDPKRLFLFTLLIIQISINVGGIMCRFAESFHTSDATQSDQNTFWVLYVTHYILASTGLMLARLIIMCILVVIVATEFKGINIEAKATSVMFKIFIVVGSIFMVWLIIDLKLCSLPIESFLPGQRGTLYARLLFSSFSLVVSLPLFILLAGEYNKAKSRAGNTKSLQASNQTIDTILIADSANYTSREDRSLSEESGHASGLDLDVSSAEYGNNAKNESSSRESIIYQFNKYSVLIIFMLIDSFLNISSVAQKLIVGQALGTFWEIEVIIVAIEFGQGILTFILYGRHRLAKR